MELHFVSIKSFVAAPVAVELRPINKSASEWLVIYSRQTRGQLKLCFMQSSCLPAMYNPEKSPMTQNAGTRGTNKHPACCFCIAQPVTDFYIFFLKP